MKYFTYSFDPSVIAVTTTKELGNMAFQVADNHEDIDKRRQEVARDFKIDQQHLIFTHQTHSDVIKEVTADDIGRGSFAFEEGIEADALYTKERGLALGIFHADCVPIFFYDKALPLVGVIHAGFKGTLKHITYKALQYVINHEKLDPQDIKIFIGPARRKSSFEVDDETKEKIIWAGCPLFGDHFDAIESNKLDLFCLGIPFANIQDINVDTVTDEHCFSAYQKTPIGRMASLILLK